MTTFFRPLATALAATGCLAGAAGAETACDEISFSDIGWADVTTTTAAAEQVFSALGYDVTVRVLAVPVTFQSLSNGETDVFLGNWMPTHEDVIAPYLEDGSVEQINVNLEGTKFNLAVPAYTYENGLKTYEDIADFSDELDQTIYGIEAGAPANVYLIGLTDKDAYGLGDFEVKESSEQGMLAQVRRAVDDQEDIIFLGWQPHPMNANFDMRYLEGGKDFFGGEGKVYTATRAGLVEDCPNAGKLLKQMDFTLAMENEIMGAITQDGAEAGDAVKAWLQDNPGILDGWLEGVTTVKGEPGLPAVKEALDISATG